jgi:ABC-type sugar transport system permease subunit
VIEIMHSSSQLITVSLALALLILAAPARGDVYPSQTNWNQASIINQDTWDLFHSIGGFGHVPNANVSGWRGGNVSIEWGDSRGHTHRAALNGSMLRAAIYYTELDGSDNEMSNLTLGTTSYDYDELVYYLTGFTGASNVTHIFWEMSHEVYDAASKYWLYHSSIDEDGTILTSAELFYYEARGGNWPLWWSMICWTILLPLMLIIVFIIIGIALLRSRRKLKEAERSSSQKHCNLDGETGAPENNQRQIP